MLVNFRPRAVRLFFGEMRAREMGLETREVCLPAGRGLRRARAVVEDVDEGQPTPVLLSGQLEAVVLAAEHPRQTIRWVYLGHLAGRAVSLEGLARRGRPIGGCWKPAL